MTTKKSIHNEHKLALSLCPASRGFGYALFEGPTRPVDWGIAEIRQQKNKICLDRAKKLIEFYRPEIMVLEDFKKSRRCQRIKSLIRQIENYANKNGVAVKKYSRSRIREVFCVFGAKTKFEIANTLCESIPAFSPLLPPKRKPWMSEDRRIKIFDAASLAITYYYLEE